MFSTNGRQLSVLLVFYLIALHTSIALMEIGAWALAAWTVLLLVRERQRPPAFVVLWPVMGLVISVALGVILNPGGRTLIFQLGFLRWALLLYFLYVAMAREWSAQFESRLVQVWSVLLIICALYALFQASTGIDLIRPDAHVISFQGGGTWRPTGFFSRSLAFAYSFGFAFLAVALPRSLRLPRWGSIMLIVCGVATMVATMARGAWLGLVAAGCIYFAFKKTRYLAVFLGATLGLAFLLVHSHTGVGDKLERMVTLTMDNSSAERLHLWRAYFAMWMDHPLFGIGLLQGEFFLPDYYQKLGIHEDFVSNAHNVYLQWLAGSGLVGLLCYLWLCAYFLRLAWSLRTYTTWGWSLLMAQVFLHVGAFTENNFFTAITNHMIIFGWAILLVQQRRILIQPPAKQPI